MVYQLIWVNFSLARTSRDQGKSEDAQTYFEHAKSHAVNNTYFLAYVMDQQARVWNGQRRFEEARSEALLALSAFEKLGAARNAEITRDLLQQISNAERAGQPSR